MIVRLYMISIQIPTSSSFTVVCGFRLTVQNDPCTAQAVLFVFPIHLCSTETKEWCILVSRSNVPNTYIIYLHRTPSTCIRVYHMIQRCTSSTLTIMPRIDSSLLPSLLALFTDTHSSAGHDVGLKRQAGFLSEYYRWRVGGMHSHKTFHHLLDSSSPSQPFTFPLTSTLTEEVVCQTTVPLISTRVRS